MKVVLDMDPGVDDAVALLLALHNPHLEVLAVTTVSGNVSLRKATANALKIMQASGKHVPVYMGASRPLGGRRPVHAEGIHGSDGLGNSNLPAARQRPEKTGAVKMLADLIKTHRRKEVSMVATGPLTNVAMLFKSEPSLVARLDRIFVMGGVYDPSVEGNVTRYAEFNFYCDPEAADIVMKDGRAIVSSGLDVTCDPACAVDAEMLAAISSAKSKSADLACRILQHPVSRYSQFNLHDVFALFSLLYPEIFKMERCSVRVDCSKTRGRCIVTPSDRGNVLACKKVDSVRFKEHLVDGLR